MRERRRDTPAGRWLAAECLFLFGGVPLVLMLWVPGAAWPWLLAAAGLACVLAPLARSACLRRCWSRAPHPAERRLLPQLAWRFAVSALLLAALVALFAPERLFNLPRENTAMWLLLLASYPLFSVLPQEVVYRYLFRLRYRRLFHGAWVWPSALAFVWLHVVFGNLLAPLLCLVAGWFFASTYRASRSLRLAVAEHTLYGVLVFSVGLGDFFLQAPV